MPPHRDGTAHEAQHRAKEQAEERDATIEEDGLDQVGVDERACDIRHEKREEPAEHALDDPLEEEWAADEVVRRADEAHDRALSCARQDGHPDCGSDDDHGHARERQSEGDASDAGDVAKRVQLLYPVFAVANVVDERDRENACRHAPHCGGVANARLELYVDRRGQRGALEHVAEFTQLPLRAGERLLLRDEHRALHFGIPRHVSGRHGHGLRLCSFRDECPDLDTLLEPVEHVADVQCHETEEPEGEQRERDGDDAQCAEQRRALEGDERVAQRTGHQGAFAAGPLDPSAESKTTAPRSISTVRNSWRLISSRLCVAIKTAVPPALISRSSWKMPRVARSSRLPVCSSAMRTNGSFTTARAMATRCCSPPDSSGGYAAPLPARPTSASTPAPLDGMADVDAPVTSIAKATFCSAVRLSRRRKSWNTMP